MSSTITPIGTGLNEALEVARKVAPTDCYVLLTGETGTGKEVIAKYIHHHSERRGKKFVGLNCTAIAKDLIESELFGHEKNAFTGANSMRIGKFEYADKGTLFLDEIAEMPLDFQVKLLRVISEKQFERVGGNTPIDTNTRLIFATNKNIQKEIDEKRFREDLYYRINVVNIHLPPLRERTQDIPPLTDHFLKSYAKEYNKIPEDTPNDKIHIVTYSPEPEIKNDDNFYIHISQQLRDRLLIHDWDGNVRALENYMAQVCIFLDKNNDHNHIVNTESIEGESLEVQPDFEKTRAELRLQLENGMSDEQIGELLGDVASIRTLSDTQLRRLYLNDFYTRNGSDIGKTAETFGLQPNEVTQILKL